MRSLPQLSCNLDGYLEHDPLSLDSALYERRRDPNFEIEYSVCFDRKSSLIKSEYLETSKPVQENKFFHKPRHFQDNKIFWKFSRNRKIGFILKVAGFTKNFFLLNWLRSSQIFTFY